VNRVGQPEVNSRAAVAAAAPDAAYVRAFNSLGWENFADPPPGAVLFFAADPGARPLAEELITAVGLEPVFVGDADACATVDALLPLWFAPGPAQRREPPGRPAHHAVTHPSTDPHPVETRPSKTT
jgi:8-hydroxy-5-deazaflavin:NADPH oxidoreductase